MSAMGETGQNGVCKQRPLICSILDPSKWHSHLKRINPETETKLTPKFEIRKWKEIRKTTKLTSDNCGVGGYSL